MIVDNVCNSLRVRGGAGPATPDGVGDLCELVGDSIGDVGAGCGAAVSAQDHAVAKVDGHAIRQYSSVSGSGRVSRVVLHGCAKTEAMVSKDSRHKQVATHLTSPFFRWFMSTCMPSSPRPPD